MGAAAPTDMRPQQDSMNVVALLSPVQGASLPDASNARQDKDFAVWAVPIGYARAAELESVDAASERQRLSLGLHARVSAKGPTSVIQGTAREDGKGHERRGVWAVHWSGDP